jgi:hypothetical protein
MIAPMQVPAWGGRLKRRYISVSSGRVKGGTQAAGAKEKGGVRTPLPRQKVGRGY